MPCGGIYPMTLTEKASTLVCWQCQKKGADCMLEEWDAFIHSECVDEFLKTDEGKIVLAHKHYVGIWENGKVKMLFKEDYDAPVSS